MSRLPVVCIVGRPNTGKSTLFNALVGKRHAIVSETPGTTRDHVALKVQTDDMDFLLVDTAGMGGGSDDRELEGDVSKQSILALAHSDLILFTMDSRSEMTLSDHTVVDALRKNRKKHVPVIIVLTKVDNPDELDALIAPYQSLGISDDIIPTSGIHKTGVDDLELAIVAHLSAMHFRKTPQAENVDSPPRIAIIGKPNVGKSSIVNALMSDPQRESAARLVTPIPGTTRDSSDTVVKHKEKEYVLVDTAGLRRQARVEEGIESFASLRSIQSVEQCDIAILVLSAEEDVSRQEKRIANLAMDEGKGLILVLNKIDTLDAEGKKRKTEEIRTLFSFCAFAPLILCSAKTRHGLLHLFPMIDTVVQNRLRRISDRELHRWYDHITQNQPLGAAGKGKHLTQADELPPTFVLFVRNPKAIKISQLRTLENSLRSLFAFEGTPMRWITKSGTKEE